MEIVGIVCGIISVIISLASKNEAKAYGEAVKEAKLNGGERPARSDSLRTSMILSALFSVAAACAFFYKAFSLLR